MGQNTDTEWTIARQSEQRQEALDQLAAAGVELVESRRRTGVLAEWKRLVRELHDTVTRASSARSTSSNRWLRRAKLGVGDRTAAVTDALEQGLLRLNER